MRFVIATIILLVLVFYLLIIAYIINNKNREIPRITDQEYEEFVKCMKEREAKKKNRHK